MTVSSANESRIYIHIPDSSNNPGYLNALTWTEIGEVDDIGDIGETFGTVQHHSFSGGPRSQFMKTVTTGKSVDIAIAMDMGDAGQTLVDQAFQSRQPYLFRVVLDDAPVIGWTGTHIIFRGLVVDNPFGIGGVDNIIRRNVSLQMVGQIFVIPPQEEIPPSAFTSGMWSIGSIGSTSFDIVINSTPSPITDIEYSIDGGAWVSLGASVPGSYLVDDLTPGTEYDVQIRAINDFGDSPASDTKVAET